MNLVKNSECLLRKSKCLDLRRICLEKNKEKRFIHQKSLPPIAKRKETKDVENVTTDEVLPAKVGKVQRDIFGATILPQKLSFENAKKLSENQIKLEDIPLVDENKVAEELLIEKEKVKTVKAFKENKKQKTDENSGFFLISTDLMKQSNEQKKSLAELFWAADPYEEIPGPKISQKLVNTLKLCARQFTVVFLFRFLKTNALRPFRTYGPIVKLPEIFGGKIILISRPEHISAIIEQDQRYPINSTFDSILRSRLQRFEKKCQNNYHSTEKWEDIRKFVKEPVTTELEKYFDKMDEAADKFMKRIRKIRNRQDEVPDDFLFEINKWSLECLCSVIFDKSFGFLDSENVFWPPKTSQLLYFLTEATKNLCSLETGFQFWRFINTTSLSSLGSACNYLENVISEYVGQVQLSLIKRKENLSKNFKNVSLVESLLLQDNSTPYDIISNILDILLIGMNTMSTSLGFLFYHLCQNPRVQSVLFKELKDILPEKYTRLEYEQLSSLEYLQACLKESLRLKMPVPVLTRVLSKNVTLSNFQIPKGTFVLMAAQVEAMKEENFDNPTEFLPERWFEQENSHPFTSLPVRNFSENSIENQIAEASLKICACQIIRHFSLEYQYGNIEATNSAISFPNKPLKFTFIDRKE